LYVSPSVNEKISKGEVNSIQFAILRYRRDEKRIEEIAQEIWDELTRDPNDDPPEYSPIFRLIRSDEDNS